ncbi:TPA: hypothetical protein N0F65_008226 [Lagenidium giganteum]|uniref:Uncharacterized protein n=1 Tax=Lagenidium giganteum TaxID=4803 RepID=A0AAV2Z0R8_9STRA|nr:TPA: hypothetical protein N0F65_008226 [Lagenidium giganteum]
MTPLLPSIDRINAALEATLPPPTGTVRVCHATEDEWNAFADSEDPIVRLNYLEWFPDTGSHHRVCRRSPRKIHSGSYTAAKNSQGRRWCPDLSYGPREDTPHSVLPPNIPILPDFRTIKVQLAPLPIVSPRTVIQLDGHRILGIPPGAPGGSCNSVGGFVLSIGLGNALIRYPAIMRSSYRYCR